MMQVNERDAPSVFWQEQPNKAYALIISGEEWARIDQATGTLTLTPQDIPFESGSLVPPYICPFSLAETQLGIDRVDDVRAVDGTPDPEARSVSERAARAQGDMRSPAQWVREYTRRAAALLKEGEATSDSLPAAREARATLTGIVRRIDPKEAMGYAREVLGPLEQVRARLIAARGEDHGVVVELCSRAVWIITYEDQKAFGRSWTPQEVRRQGTWDDPDYDEDVPAETSAHFGGPKGRWRFQVARAGRDSDIEHGRDDYDHERKW